MRRHAKNIGRYFVQYFRNRCYTFLNFLCGEILYTLYIYVVWNYEVRSMKDIFFQNGSLKIIFLFNDIVVQNSINFFYGSFSTKMNC